MASDKIQRGVALASAFFRIGIDGDERKFVGWRIRFVAFMVGGRIVVRLATIREPESGSD